MFYFFICKIVKKFCLCNYLSNTRETTLYNNTSPIMFHFFVCKIVKKFCLCNYLSNTRETTLYNNTSPIGCISLFP